MEGKTSDNSDQRRTYWIIILSNLLESVETVERFLSLADRY